MQVINFIQRDTLPGIQNAEGQAFSLRFILVDFQRDFANLRGGYRILDQQQQNTAQGIAVAAAFIMGAKVIFNQ